jgi:AraC-like DNA-binding protein
MRILIGCPGGRMKLFIKNMVCTRCKTVVKEELNKLGLTSIVVDLGEVEIMGTMSDVQYGQFKTALLKAGLELMDNRKSMLIEKIRNVVIQLVHHTDDQLKTNFSDFLSEKLGYDYTYMANIFSEVQGITIEKFMIAHKIERVKELLVYDELSLTEIAQKLHYSSVAHLSNQFKKITGLTASHFKQLKDKRRKNLENV